MGREIRKVPPNWDHPKQEEWSDGRLQPMYKQTFAEAAAKWKAEYAAWERGERPSYFKADNYPADLQYWEWSNNPPPDREYYRTYSDEEATWIQVWETVSEGTPVTPPFATPEELIDYLAIHGDFWDQQQGDGPWPRANAEKFVADGYAPSLIIAGGKIYTPKDGFPPA